MTQAVDARLTDPAVGSALAPTRLPDTPPHGAKEMISYPPLFPWAWILAGAGAAILITFFWWRHRKKKARLARQKGKLPRDPLPELLLQISSLKPQEPFDKKKASGFYYLLGMGFREILEHCCLFPATDMTRKELEQPISDILWLEREDKDFIRQFLGRADLIKFSEVTASCNEALRHQEQIAAISARLIEKFRKSRDQIRSAPADMAPPQQQPASST